MSAKQALAGSSRIQATEAVRICAGLLRIDEAEAMRIDPEIILPALWATLQYRGLSSSERNVAGGYFDALRPVSPTLFRALVSIRADVEANPEWYPWSLTEAELGQLIRTNKNILTVFKYLGFSPLAAGAMVGSFSKALREKFLSAPMSTILKGAAKSAFSLPAIVIGAYLHALDEAAAEEGFEALRRKEREGRERMAEDIETQHGVPVNRLILGPSPIERALY